MFNPGQCRSGGQTSLGRARAALPSPPAFSRRIPIDKLLIPQPRKCLFFVIYEILAKIFKDKSITPNLPQG
jgi:hypothetical protein